MAATAPWRFSTGIKAGCTHLRCSTASCSRRRYTRHLDTHGLLRFQNWKLYAERGLPKAPVTVWVYDGSLATLVPGRDPGLLHGRSRRRSPPSTRRQPPAPGPDAVPLTPVDPLDALTG